MISPRDIRVTVTCAVLAACALFLSCGSRAASSTGTSTWETDYQSALRRAREERKPVLMNFTGSDWCVWCIRLSEEVFSQPAFQSYAAENLVLLTLDFPRQKDQPPEIAQQNRELAQRFGVQGFPTIIIADGSGKEIGRTGYRQSGAAAYVEHLRAITGR